MGWETRLVPFGPEIYGHIYSIGFATRAAMAFGGVKPGDYKGILRYNKDRVFAFVLALGEVDDMKYAAAAGAINYGFPTIAETDIPEILPTGVCTYEHVVSNVPLKDIVAKAIEVRGLKIVITEVPVPVAYGPAFEGERIRKEDLHVEMAGPKAPGAELTRHRRERRGRQGHRRRPRGRRGRAGLDHPLRRADRGVRAARCRRTSSPSSSVSCTTS